ncbi:MAG: glycoside hydrolase family 73 protein [Flammeovirgaceae bacterium]
MRVKKFTFSFQQGKGVRTFVPNQNFWILLLLIFGAIGWFLNDAFQTHQKIAQEFDYLQTEIQKFNEGIADVHPVIDQPIATTPNTQEAVEFAPKIWMALLGMLSLFIRKLINFSLKLNNILLLGQAKAEQFTLKPIKVRLGNRTLSYHPNNRVWYVLAGAALLMVGSFYYLNHRNTQMQAEIAEMKSKTLNLEELFDAKQYKDDVMGYFIDYFHAYDKNQKNIQKDYREAFLIQKQLLVSKFLIQEKVARVDQLSNASLLQMNHQIAGLFEDLVLNKLAKIEPHVHGFFTDTTKVDKLETALMEQAKYHVPASITLAQAALETAWGRRIVNNNYFGIKDKSKQSAYMETTEYYTAAEAKLNKHKILSKKKVNKGGKVLYKCKVRDSFTEYPTPWASFRAHSVFLANNNRYSPLFTKGKDYQAWADKIGSTKYGGVGYATSPIYGELLKKIIQRYHLDLLDY